MPNPARYSDDLLRRFARRRQAFQTALPEDGVAVFFTAPSRVRSNDVHFRYRQDSDFFYLTGFDEEDAVLVLTKKEEVLFVPKKNRQRETWEGPRLSTCDAAEALGIKEVKPYKAFRARLAGLLKDKATLYYRFGEDPNRDAEILPRAYRVMRNSRKGSYGPDTVVNPGVILHEQRLIKDSFDLAALEECARLTENGHLEIMRAAKPGTFEYELEAMLQYAFRRDRGTEGYPSIVASGANACVLHHIQNDRAMQAGDLVLVDAGAEKDFMNADVTRTWPVSDRYTPEQRDVYQAVLDAQKNAIARTVAGSSLVEVHNATVRDLTQSLLDMNVLDRSIPLDKHIEDESYSPFYMHRTGHWLGMDVHDLGPYYDKGEPRKFADGMVCTVEPGLYFLPHHPKTPEAFRGIGVRIEDDVMVRGETPVVITESIPKEIEEVEALRREAAEHSAAGAGRP